VITTCIHDLFFSMWIYDSWSVACFLLSYYLILISLVVYWQVEFDEYEKAIDVTSEGETARCKKAICDPSYLPNKVALNNFEINLLLHCYICWNGLWLCQSPFICYCCNAMGKESWKGCSCYLYNESSYSWH